MKSKRINWILLAFALIVPAFASLPALAQSEEPASDTIFQKSSWTIGLETATNSTFYGRNTAVKYPFAAATLTYSYHNGFWASVTSYQLFNTEDYIDETDLSVGYSFSLGKRVSASLSYSCFLFSKNAPIVKSVTENAASAYAALDWGFLYSALTTSYFFGNSSDVFLVFENSRYIPLNNIWGGKSPIGLDPKIGVTAGTQEFSQTYTVERKKELGEKVGGGLGNGLGGILNPGKGNGNGTSNEEEETTTTTTTETKHSFNVLNYDFYLPLVIMVGSFEIEPSWRYSVPVNKLEGDESKAQSVFAAKASYTF